MSFFKRIFTFQNKKLIFKYIGISLISYLYTFSSLYFLIEAFNFDKTISFILVYGLAYIFLYAIQLRYLFNKKHDPKKLSRYLVSIILFYIAANVFYNLGLKLELHYLLASALTILILIPLRLVFYNFYVYKD